MGLVELALLIGSDLQQLGPLDQDNNPNQLGRVTWIFWNPKYDDIKQNIRFQKTNKLSRNFDSLSNAYIQKLHVDKKQYQIITDIYELNKIIWLMNKTIQDRKQIKTLL